MAKVSGLGSVVKVADATPTLQIISNDVTNYSISTPRATQDVTGVDKFANERILLLADISTTWNGVFNSAGTGGGSDTANSHAVFATVPSTNVVRATEFDPIGTTTGNPKLVTNQLLTDYQLTRAATGELTWQVPGVLADGNAPTWTVN